MAEKLVSNPPLGIPYKSLNTQGATTQPATPNLVNKNPVLIKDTPPVGVISADSVLTENAATANSAGFAIKSTTNKISTAAVEGFSQSLYAGNDIGEMNSLVSVVKKEVTTAPMPTREALGVKEPPTSDQVSQSLTNKVGEGVVEKLSSSSIFGKTSDADGNAKLAVTGATMIAEKLGIGDSNLVTNVLGAAAGDKQAQINVGGKALQALTNGAISADVVSNIGAALGGDKQAQGSLAMDVTGKLFNNSPEAKGVMSDVLTIGGMTGGNKVGAGLSLLTKGTEGLMKLTGASSNSALGGMLGGLTTISNVFSIREKFKDVKNAYKNSMAGKSRIERIRSRRDPLLGFEWFAVMPEIQSAGINIKHEVLSFHVEDVTITEPTMQVRDFYRANKKYVLPGNMDTGSITVTFYEDNALNTKKYLEAWYDSIYDFFDMSYTVHPSTLRDFQICLVDAKDTIIGTLDVNMAFPLNIGNMNLTSGSSDRVTYPVEFAVNNLMWNFNQTTAKERKNKATVDGFVDKLFGGIPKL